LIRGLAHEIKNPLGGIRGAAQLLERELDRPPLIEYTQVIIGEADRLQTLVDRMLTPHRLPKYRRTNIHEILARVGSVVQAEFPRIAIVSDFDISLPEFEADPEQLTQAVFNVVRNAAQALEGTTKGPQIRLMTRVARGATLAKRRHRLALALSIEDNGSGVPEAIRGVGTRGRQRTRPDDRPDIHRAAQRCHRLRERARAHCFHDPAAAGVQP
jgi:two-component system nitrogen regulation sensor histidine kinase GlnL